MQTDALATQKQIDALNRRLARQKQIAASTAAEIDKVAKRHEQAPSANLDKLIASLDAKLRRNENAVAITAAYIELLTAEITPEVPASKRVK